MTIELKHVENAVAKVLRENWPINGRNTAETRARAHTHVSIALDMARWFDKTDETFKAPDWLDKCVPDGYEDLYPLSELWEV